VISSELTLNPSLKKRGTCYAPLLFLREGVGGGEFKLHVMNNSIYDIAKKTARSLRRSQTPAEEKLWNALRDRQFLGKKFYRQHPILFEYLSRKTFFIVDFYCHEGKLVIEIDGRSHDYQKDRDELRTHIINALGITVLRFKNEEIKYKIESVLGKLKSSLQQ